MSTAKKERKIADNSLLRDMISDIRNIGPAATKRKYGLSSSQIQDILVENRMAFLKEEKCLQKEVLRLKHQGYNSGEVARILGEPLPRVNDLWNVFIKN
jgi:hypothetical protein